MRFRYDYYTPIEVEDFIKSAKQDGAFGGFLFGCFLSSLIWAYHVFTF